MKTEHEIKYIVQGQKPGSLLDWTATNIEQTYLDLQCLDELEWVGIEPGATEARLRCKTSSEGTCTYTFTVKYADTGKGAMLSRGEREISLDAQSYQKLLSYGVSRITKTRYTKNACGYVLELDYFPDMGGLWLLEVELDPSEFNEVDDMVQVMFPGAQNVSKDSRYKNKNMAQAYRK